MAEEVIMPKLEMAQETGKLVEWLRKEGERVEKGEALFTIETDKVTVEIEAPASGILGGIRADVGEEIPVATVIAYILEEGEELPEGFVAIPADVPQEEPSLEPVLASPVARRLAEEHGIDLGGISGTGTKGQITKADVERAVEAATPEAPAGKVRATPAARRLARERGINLASLQGSGPGGRIQEEDIPEVGPSIPLAGERIPLEGMRKTIAERMMMSYQTTPHINFTVRVDMSGVERSRPSVNAEAQAKGFDRVTLTSFIVKAVAWALKRHPYLNSTLEGEEIHLLPEINIGVAVALEDGLIVPVVHNADQVGLLEISNRVNDIVSRAHEGSLTPSDVAGGTFTISNLGPFGIEQFTAIINPPQTATLAVGALQREAIPDSLGQLGVKPMMRMTLSADHRVIDGAIAARFMMDLKDALEKAWLLQL
jgi:pyruvate dehydrogenase E2 component (dihydrolipoamide acetyltransferase)